MSHKVFLTRQALRDLEELDDFLSNSDSPANAERIISKIEIQLRNLSEVPERGNQPRELLALGIKEYRQVYLKPYRIIYCVKDGVVFVVLIADGRRDMETLLQARLLS